MNNLGMPKGVFIILLSAIVLLVVGVIGAIVWLFVGLPAVATANEGDHQVHIATTAPSLEPTTISPITTMHVTEPPTEAEHGDDEFIVATTTLLKSAIHSNLSFLDIFLIEFQRDWLLYPWHHDDDEWRFMHFTIFFDWVDETKMSAMQFVDQGIDWLRSHNAELPRNYMTAHTSYVYAVTEIHRSMSRLRDALISGFDALYAGDIALYEEYMDYAREAEGSLRISLLIISFMPDTTWEEMLN